LSCNCCSLAWTSSVAGTKAAASHLAAPFNAEIGQTLLQDETRAASPKGKAGFEAFMDENGAFNGEADMTSKPRAEFLAGLPGIANRCELEIYIRFLFA
jgi:hypothetical protein